MKKGFSFLLILLLASGCGAAVQTTDWCYRFDFADSDYSATINSGVYTSGTGFSPDPTTGIFEIDYEHDEDVTPEQVIIQAARGDSNQVPINVTAEVVAFGFFSGQRSTVVPAAATSVDLSLFPGNGPGTGRHFYVYGNSSRTIFLTGLVVLGNGDNPFPENNCGPLTDPGSDAIPLPVPEAGLLDALSSANDDLESVNVPLAAPDGSPLLPDETGTVVWGYAKWLTSPAAAQELLGPFAAIYYHVGYLIALDVALVGIYIVVYGAVYVARWAMRLIRVAMSVIDLILQMLQVVTSAAGGALRWLLSFIGIGG
jgi:hypothetical protein